MSAEKGTIITAISGCRALVTGASRGLGAALVSELLARDTRTVVAGVRGPAGPRPASFADARVTMAKLDVTDDADVESAAHLWDIDLLINNAGVWGPVSLLAAADLSTARREMETNYFGTLRMCRAFAPGLRRAQGTIINILSISALASMPAAGSYSASKAAALSLTQALRAELADDHVAVHAVIAGKIHSDMAGGRARGGALPGEVAAAILDAVENDQFMIFPDPQAQLVAELAAADQDALLAFMGSRR